MAGEIKYQFRFPNKPNDKEIKKFLQAVRDRLKCLVNRLGVMTLDEDLSQEKMDTIKSIAGQYQLVVEVVKIAVA